MLSASGPEVGSAQPFCSRPFPPFPSTHRAGSSSLPLRDRRVACPFRRVVHHPTLRLSFFFNPNYWQEPFFFCVGHSPVSLSIRIGRALSEQLLTRPDIDGIWRALPAVQAVGVAAHVPVDLSRLRRSDLFSSTSRPLVKWPPRTIGFLWRSSVPAKELEPRRVVFGEAKTFFDGGSETPRLSDSPFLEPTLFQARFAFILVPDRSPFNQNSSGIDAPVSCGFRFLRF